MRIAARSVKTQTLMTATTLTTKGMTRARRPPTRPQQQLRKRARTAPSSATTEPRTSALTKRRMCARAPRTS